MVALVQRTVQVVPWPGGIDGYRTLVNSEGVAALPIFTTRDELDEAARRFGWLGADGAAPAAEIGARQALHYALEQSLAYVVIDIAAAHALELTREEFEPLLSPAARRDSQGPYAAAGKISSSLLRKVTPTPGSLRAPDPIEPPRMDAAQAPPPSAASPAAPAPQEPASSPPPANDGFTVRKDFDPSAQSFGGGHAATLTPLPQPASDALYDALTTVCRNYPEVEWAALCQASRGPTAAVPTVGVRVDTGFRQRVNEIVAELRRAGEAHGASLDVLLLDDPVLMRTARAAGVFYPWRKK